MLDVRQVAERLNVCKMTVYRLIHAEQIPAVRVGKSYRIDNEDFEAYLRKVRTGDGASVGAGKAKA